MFQLNEIIKKECTLYLPYNFVGVMFTFLPTMMESNDIVSSVNISNRKSKKRRLLVVIALGFISLGIYFFYEASQNWMGEPVSDVKLKGLSYLQGKEILELLELQKNESYNSKKLKEKENRIRSNLAVKKVKVYQDKKTVWVEIEEKNCLALIEDQVSHKIYDIDAFGFILSASSSRCKNVPLIRGDYKKEGNIFKSRGLQRILNILESIHKSYPELSSRFSEIRLNHEGSITLYLSNTRLRIDLPIEFEEVTIRRLYASVAYFLNQNIKSGWVDLRGPEGILHAGNLTEAEK